MVGSAKVGKAKDDGWLGRIVQVAWHQLYICFQSVLLTTLTTA